MYLLLFKLSLKILQLQIIFSSLIGEKLYLRIVLICSSLVMNGVEHLSFSPIISSCPFLLVRVAVSYTVFRVVFIEKSF